jgi:hypothetical protein
VPVAIGSGARLSLSEWAITCPVPYRPGEGGGLAFEDGDRFIQAGQLENLPRVDRETEDGQLLVLAVGPDQEGDQHACSGMADEALAAAEEALQLDGEPISTG